MLVPFSIPRLARDSIVVPKEGTSNCCLAGHVDGEDDHNEHVLFQSSFGNDKLWIYLVHESKVELRSYKCRNIVLISTI